MKVRCISTSLDARQKIALALPPNGVIFDNRLTVGEEYLVIGLTYELGSTNAGAGVYVHVLLTNGDVAYSHLYLFEVIDPRSSRYWHVRMVQFDGGQFVELLPPTLFGVLSTTDDDARTSLEQERASATALHSPEFRHTCDLLRREFDGWSV
jgi:hypothetical protein